MYLFRGFPYWPEKRNKEGLACLRNYQGNNHTTRYGRSLEQNSWWWGPDLHIICILASFYFPLHFRFMLLWSHRLNAHLQLEHIRWTSESIFHFNFNQNEYNSSTPNLFHNVNYITVDRNVWEMFQKRIPDPKHNKCSGWTSFFWFPRRIALPALLCTHDTEVSAQNLYIPCEKYPEKLKANHTT